jgi:mannose-6-phosphate isomerase-like protein (cupin superfamily)
MSDPQSWPDHLDALIASPDQHELLFENERVRVLHTRIKPGERTPVHTHRWPGILYILSWGSFIRYDDQGEVLVDSRKVEALRQPPAVMWTPVLPPHSFENVGDTPIDLINVELKESVP